MATSQRKKLTARERKEIAHWGISPARSYDKSITKMVQARKTALLLIEKKERLLEILRRVGGEERWLSVGLTSDVEGLRRSINNYESSIKEMAYDLDVCIKWAIGARNEYLKLKSRRAALNRGNGVGMYNLGNKPKRWR